MRMPPMANYQVSQNWKYQYATGNLWNTKGSSCVRLQQTSTSETSSVTAGNESEGQTSYHHFRLHENLHWWHTNVATPWWEIRQQKHWRHIPSQPFQKYTPNQECATYQTFSDQIWTDLYHLDYNEFKTGLRMPLSSLGAGHIAITIKRSLVGH